MKQICKKIFNKIYLQAENIFYKNNGYNLTTILGTTMELTMDMIKLTEWLFNTGRPEMC